MEKKYQEILIRPEGPVNVEVDLETQELLRDSKYEIDKLTDFQRKITHHGGLHSRISNELEVLHKLRNKFEELILKN